MSVSAPPLLTVSPSPYHFSLKTTLLFTLKNMKEKKKRKRMHPRNIH